MNRHIFLLSIFLILLAQCSFSHLKADNKQFTLILDPGHGGKDPGAMSKHGREKDINLKVALLAGELIQAKHKDVKIIYTRSTDKYVTLKERPNIANKSNGDFFISIHTNACESKSVYGAETYTFGLAKTNANFEVAKRENSVILLESDNKEAYHGFDPNSPDSYIMFELMQSKYIDQSVELADYIQKEFAFLNRFNRGVKQESFWVLHQVKMPSVLIELGFISNANEENYLMSQNGIQALAKAIVKAFDKYKHEYDKKTISSISKNIVSKSTEEIEEESKLIEQQGAATEDKTETTSNKQSNKDIIFKLQTFSSKVKLSDNHDEIKKIKKYQPVEYIYENGWYKYSCGHTNNYDEILEIKEKLKKQFPDAFVIAFKNNKKISVKDALNTK